MVLCVVVFQVPLFIPALFSFTCLFMVALSLYSDPVNTGIGFAITLTGIPAYYLFIVWDNKPKWFRKLLGKSWWGTSLLHAGSRSFSELCLCCEILWIDALSCCELGVTAQVAFGHVLQHCSTSGNQCPLTNEVHSQQGCSSARDWFLMTDASSPASPTNI